MLYNLNLLQIGLLISDHFPAFPTLEGGHVQNLRSCFVAAGGSVRPPKEVTELRCRDLRRPLKLIGRE